MKLTTFYYYEEMKKYCKVDGCLTGGSGVRKGKNTKNKGEI